MGNSHGHSHGQGRGHGHGHAGGESEAKPAPLSGAQEEAASDAMEVAHTDNVDDDDDADAAPPSRSSHRRHSSFRGMYDALTRRKSTESRRSSSLAKDKSQRVKTMDVGARYEIEYKQLGAGHYGVVRKCHRRDTKQAFAIKSIKKSRVSKVETLLREIDILRAVDHPSIIKLYEVYSDDRYIHLITELCTGGELFDRIIKKTETEEGRYSERDAAKVMKRILEGIEYCHNVHNICHRDLKPENFLFLTPNGDDDIKIIDFGLSRFEEANTAMTTRVGTPYYIAPEVLGRHYDKACDLWSLGVITYILLSGYPPFYGDNDQEIFNSVRAGVFEFSSPEWDGISLAAKSFITSLLMMDPSKRLTATEALQHVWIVETTAPATVPPAKDLVVPRLNHRLRRFVGMNKLKKVALNVIAQQLTEAEIGHLRKAFEDLDADGNGVISISELQSLMEKEGLSNIEAEVKHLLQGIDIDGSNTLDYREFLAATMERNLFIQEDNIKKAFTYFDLGSSGKITKQNLVEIFGSEEHAKEIMGHVDLNSDGYIEYAEFKQMMTDH